MIKYKPTASSGMAARKMMAMFGLIFNTITKENKNINGLRTATRMII